MNNYKGMNTKDAQIVMGQIVDKKADVSKKTKEVTGIIIDEIVKAFSGNQVGAMQGFVGRVDEALQELYNYLDGKDSSFAQTLNEFIGSYDVSDETVASDYNSANVQ